MRFIKSRQTAIDLGLFAVVTLMFFAGVLFEANRSGRDLPAAPGVGADIPPASTSDGLEPGSESLPEEADAPLVDAEASPTAAPATPTPAPVVSGTPNPAAVGLPVFLDIAGVENESVVEAENVTLVGATTPDALVSINGQSVPVELDGSFSLELQLEPGPNFIDIVSSNLKGEETRRVISVVSVQ